MRIERLQLRDVMRFRDLDLELASGLTIVRGPNESGKTTIAKAIELGLATSVVDPAVAAGIGDLRSWDADPGARPTVSLEFTAGPEGDATEPVKGTVEKAFAATGGTATLTVGGAVETESAVVDGRLAELTGLPTPAFFRSTALVGHGELEGLDRDETTLGARLGASISAADRATIAATSAIQEVLTDLAGHGDRSTGRLRVAEDAVARSQVGLDQGEAALARLVADRTALGETEVASETAAADLAARQALLEQARTAELLGAEQAAVADRFARYDEAAVVGVELTRLHATHPSPHPLPVLRQTVDRLRVLDAKTTELKAMLSGEIQVRYEVTTPAPTWRPVAILAIVAILVGVGLAIGSWIVDGLEVLGPAGLAVVIVGAILAIIGIRQRKTAQDLRRQKELAGSEVERRLRGRSQMEAELREAEADTAAQLGGLGLSDLAAAEDMLAREETHVAAIAELGARLDGLVGKEPLETLAPTRDAAKAEMERKAAELGALPPDTVAPGARVRFEGEVRVAETAREAARTAEANARAQVVANTVDPDQVAGEAERLATWREELAALQRKARIHEAALGGIERAIETTMERATRYLERRMTGSIARITDGRYRRVRVDDATFEIAVHVPEKDDWVNVRRLSDGTVGQVYLAARLGLVRHLTDDRRPPLVLDDPFASFDDDRAARAFALLRDLTADHQVVYLTTSDRYDRLADAVVELPSPTAVDAGTDAIDGAAADGPA
jgi:hypothetical protein